MIHSSRVSAGVCQRKDNRSDVSEVKQINGTVIIDMAEADFTCLVTCTRCRCWLKASKPRRQRMEAEQVA